MIRKTFKLIVLVFVGMFFLGLSELAYIYNNPGASVLYRFYVSKIFSNIGLQKYSVRMLQETALDYTNFNPESSTLPRELLPDKVSLNHVASSNPALKKYIQNLQYQEYKNNKDFSLIFYEIFILLENKDTLASENLLKTSIITMPSFSFWWVELANYYQSEGNTQKSIDVLNNCISLQIYAPRKHCLEHLEYIMSNKASQKLGFLKIYVDQYFENFNKNE